MATSSCALVKPENSLGLLNLICSLFAQEIIKKVKNAPNKNIFFILFYIY